MLRFAATFAFGCIVVPVQAKSLDMVGRMGAGGMVTCYSKAAAEKKAKDGMSRELFASGDCFIFDNGTVARVESPDAEISRAVMADDDRPLGEDSYVWVFPQDMEPADNARDRIFEATDASAPADHGANATSITGRAPAVICHAKDDAVSSYMATYRGDQKFVEELFRSGRCALLHSNYVASIDDPDAHLHVYEAVVLDRGYTVGGFIAMPFLN